MHGCTGARMHGCTDARMQVRTSQPIAALHRKYQPRDCLSRYIAVLAGHAFTPAAETRVTLAERHAVTRAGGTRSHAGSRDQGHAGRETRSYAQAGTPAGWHTGRPTGTLAQQRTHDTGRTLGSTISRSLGAHTRGGRGPGPSVPSIPRLSRSWPFQLPYLKRPIHQCHHPVACAKRKRSGQWGAQRLSQVYPGQPCASPASPRYRPHGWGV